MRGVRLRLRIFIIVLAVAMVAGVTGFMGFEGLSLVDAFYFTVVTVATVGYGDVSPQTTGGKLLATAVIVMGVGAFVGVIGNAIELMLARREQAERLEKLNMVIGAFFSELGTRLLRVFSQASDEAAAIRDQLHVDAQWTPERFAEVRSHLDDLDYTVDAARIDLDALAAMLEAKREFLVRLLENPVLLEHEAFTDVLWAVFHLTEELSARDDRGALPDSDREHLAGDMKRAYGRLARQWLAYMEHLKDRYPYLFSLAVRSNPFDPDASPVVR
ncbi:MAG: potassium channel family protein [Planctomycetota bacterium]